MQVCMGICTSGSGSGSAGRGHGQKALRPRAIMSARARVRACRPRLIKNQHTYQNEHINNVYNAMLALVVGQGKGPTVTRALPREVRQGAERGGRGAARHRHRHQIPTNATPRSAAC